MNKLINAHKTGSGHNSYNLIIGTPTSGTFGDYLLLKEHYKKLDKEHDWRYKVAFNIKFLRGQKLKYKVLTCAYCGKTELIIETPSGANVPQSLKATVDHFIPPGLGGGEYDHDNFIVSCGKCNGKKGQEIYDTSKLKFAPIPEKEKIEKYIQKIHVNVKV